MVYAKTHMVDFTGLLKSSQQNYLCLAYCDAGVGCLKYFGLNWSAKTIIKQTKKDWSTD